MIVVKADIRDGECQAEPVKLTASSGTIKSPGYDQGTYPNNANCQWLIMAPADEVNSIAIMTILIILIPVCNVKIRNNPSYIPS